MDNNDLSILLGHKGGMIKDIYIDTVQTDMEKHPSHRCPKCKAFFDKPGRYVNHTGCPYCEYTDIDKYWYNGSWLGYNGWGTMYGVDHSVHMYYSFEMGIKTRWKER